MLAVSGTDLLNATVIGVVFGAVYSLTAIGLVLIYRSSGIFNFAQAEFGTVAVYGTWYTSNYGIPIPFVGSIDVPYGVAAVIGVLSGVAVALVTERFVIRPLSQGPKVTLLVATAGIALLAIGVQFWRTAENAGKFLDPLTQWDGIRLGVDISGQRILTLVVLVIAVVALTLFLRSPYGLAILAASQDADAAELIGLDTRRISMLVWGLAGLLGAVGGIMLTGGTPFGPGTITSAALIPGFTAAVIGGLSSLPGAVVGGMTIGLLQSFGSLSTFDAVPGASAITVFLVLLLVLLFKPEGLLGGTS